MHLCLKAVRCAASSEDEKISSSPVIFSNVTFGREEISSSMTPCADFYFRLFPPDGVEAGSIPTNPMASFYSSPADETFHDLESAIKVDLTLIVLWKAIVSTPDGGVTTLVGQHHVTVDTINNLVTSYPQTKASPELPPVRLIREVEPPPAPKPSSQVTTQLSHYSFDHAPHVQHDFTRNRLCFVPVTMTIQNCSSVPLNVLVDTSNARERLENEAGSQMTGNTFYPAPGVGCNSFSWSGGTVVEKKLQERESTGLKLTACFPKPGIYNLNQLAVFVSYKEDFSEMILQKHSVPSVVTVTNTNCGSAPQELPGS